MRLAPTEVDRWKTCRRCPDVAAVHNSRHGRGRISGRAVGQRPRPATPAFDSIVLRLEGGVLVRAQTHAGRLLAVEPKQRSVHDFRPDCGTAAVAHHYRQEVGSATPDAVGIPKGR